MKSIFTLFLLATTFLGTAQDKNITVNFTNVSLADALVKIETVSDYQMYFDASWLTDQTQIINQNFVNTPVSEIVGTLLTETPLNYYIAANKIILIKNSAVYDDLPSGFFGDTDNQLATKKPIFFREYDSLSNSDASVSLIGKDSKNGTSNAYTISGVLRDGKSNQPVSQVIIRIKGTSYETETDANGYYELTLPGGNYALETMSFSHDRISKNIVVYSDGVLNLKLRENINVLDEVIITGKENKTVREAISGVTTIDIESIKNIPLVMGERDIMKVATILPGVKVTGEGSAGYSVRGGKEDQNLIQLDNAVLYNPSHLLGFFSAVNPFTTQSANIYKGSIPAEFGGRLSSVFDLKSKKATSDKITGEAGVGPVTSNVAVNLPIVKGKAGLLVGGRATYSGWILRSLNNEKLSNSKASFYDGIVKYNHQINDKNDIEATGYYSKDAFSITADSLFQYSNRLISIGWNHTFNDKNKASLIFTNSEYKFGVDYDSDNLNAFDLNFKINESQALIKATYALSNKHKFNYGISAKSYNISPGNFKAKNAQSLLEPVNLPQEKAFESALYISDSFTVTDKLLIDLGLRYSFFGALGEATRRIYEPNVPLSDATVIDEITYAKNEVIKTYGGFEPRIAMRYFLGNNFSVKGGFDQTYQYIHLLSSNTTQSPTDTWKLSDSNVKPQISQQYSLGLYKNFNERFLELSVEGYFKRSSNILDYKVAAQLLLNENIETQLLQGEGKASGVEFLIKKTAGRLNGWIGYTYSRTFIKLDSEFNDEKVNNGEYFAANFDKPHDFSTVLNYKITQRYSVSANFIYQTGRPITYPIGSYQYGNAQYTLYSDRNKFRIPDYFRVDVGFNVEGDHRKNKLAHSFWNFSIYNLLGRNNPYSVYFVTESGQIKAYQTSIFAIPIPTVTYNFKF